MMYGFDNYWGLSNYSGLGWFGGMIMMAIFWVALVFLIVWLVREISGGRREKDEDKSLSILKERYAKGEIDKKEFEEKKKELSS